MGMYHLVIQLYLLSYILVLPLLSFMSFVYRLIYLRDLVITALIVLWKSWAPQT